MLFISHVSPARKGRIGEIEPNGESQNDRSERTYGERLSGEDGSAEEGEEQARGSEATKREQDLGAIRPGGSNTRMQGVDHQEGATHKSDASKRKGAKRLSASEAERKIPPAEKYVAPAFAVKAPRL